MTRPAATRVTRLAPSPTGALHLGNARTFVINWALAQRHGWRVILRIEDLDTPRVKPQTVAATLEILAWLGLTWDDGPVTQSHDLAPYHAALDRLRRDGHIYPCRCTRKEIEHAQSAPHAHDHELRYPGTCRPTAGAAGMMLNANANANANADAGSASAWRLMVPAGPVSFVDAVRGVQSIDVQAEVGDFIVATKAGLPAYQLAVVVDDARQGVTDVVRGDDLLGSAARQRLLYQWLGLTPLPNHYHVPLVLGRDGRRLAKRHGDTRVAAYREAGVGAQRVVGLIAYWSGITDTRREMAAAEFADAFDLGRLPARPVVFTPEDDAWLRDGS